MTEPIAEPAVEPIAEPIAEPITEPTTPTFREGLSEANQAHASAEKFKDADGFFKSYTEMESMIGKKGIIPPDMENPDDVTRYYTERGVPDAADKYELDAIPEWAQALNYDQGVLKGIAHEAKLEPWQAKIVEQGYLTDAQNTNTQYAASQKEAAGKAEQDNRSTWGEKYDEKVNVSNMVAEKFSGENEELAGRLKEQMVNDPEFRAIMAEIGSNFAEHRIGDFEQTKYDMSTDAAQKEIDEMRADFDGPYMSDKDPVAHKKAVDRMDVLYKTAQPRR